MDIATIIDAPATEIADEKRQDSVTFSVRPALRRAIDRVAKERSLSRSDVIRQAMLYGLHLIFSEFSDIFVEEKKLDD